MALVAAKNTPPQRDARGEAELAKLLAGRVAGPATNCIDLHSIDNTQIINHTAIVYRDGKTVWVNRPGGNLDALDDNSILVTEDYASQLCRIDPVRLIDRDTRFPRGILVFEDFVPYTKAP